MTTVQRVTESDMTEVTEHHDTADSFERESLIKQYERTLLSPLLRASRALFEVCPRAIGRGF